jgi:cytochrome c-type biogenesis protein CcmE
MQASSRRPTKFLVGGAVVVVALVALVGWAMSRPGSTSFYLTVAELQQEGPRVSGEIVRVNGNVVPGSLEQQGVRTSFSISDGSSDLVVTTNQPLPDAFSTGYSNDPRAVEVVAEGRYEGGAFHARQVLAKCPSKFKAKV